MTNQDRRTDSTTSMKIAFALRIQRAFGPEVARTFAESQHLETGLASGILSTNNDRRQKVRRIHQRPLTRAIAAPDP